MMYLFVIIIIIIIITIILKGHLSGFVCLVLC